MQISTGEDEMALEAAVGDIVLVSWSHAGMNKNHKCLN